MSALFSKSGKEEAQLFGPAWLVFALIAVLSISGAYALDAYESGLALAKDRHYAEAIEQFNKAISANPSNIDAYVELGKTYLYLKQENRSIQYLNKALALKPNYPQALVARASYYLVKGEYQKCINDTTRASTSLPDDGWLYALRAQAYRCLNNPTAALHDIDKAVRYGQRRPGLFLMRGRCYIELEQYEKGLSDMNRVLSMRPDNADALMFRSSALAGLGEYEKGLIDLKKVLSLKPKYPVYAIRGDIFFKSGDLQKALQDYNTQIRLFPQDSGAYFGRARAYLSLNNTQAALKDFAKSMALEPEQKPPIVLFQLREYFNAHPKEREPAANLNALADTYSGAIALFPKEEPFYSARAYIFYRLKQYQRSIEDCNRVIEFKPTYAEAWETRGNLHVKLGDYKQALHDYNQALKFNPNLFGLFRSRGYTCLKLGQYQNAIKDYTHVLDLLPDDLDSYRRRAEAYDKLGKRELAAADRQKLQEKLDKKQD